MEDDDKERVCTINIIRSIKYSGIRYSLFLNPNEYIGYSAV
jgi:hypothetical protein